MDSDQIQKLQHVIESDTPIYYRGDSGELLACWRIVDNSNQGPILHLEEAAFVYLSTAEPDEFYYAVSAKSDLK